MKMKRLSILFIAVLISACAQTEYHWGGYENALYRYYKSPAELESLAEELKDVIAQGERDEKIPPGIYAELGYVLLAQGKNREAIAYFEKEEKSWPESARLMSIMIKSAETSNNKKPAGVKGGNP